MKEIFWNAVSSVLQKYCTPEIVRKAETGQGVGGLWRELNAAGYADALVPEASGGAGMALQDLVNVFQELGYYAVPIPFGETLLIRGLYANEQSLPSGPITFSRGMIKPDGAVECAYVRCARTSDHVLVVTPQSTFLLDTASAEASPAISPLDAGLAWNPTVVSSATRFPDSIDVNLYEGCLYAAQLTGALLRVYEMTLQYANEREQFGRPIGRFQVIQHHLAIMSEHVAAAKMAAQIGCLSDGIEPSLLRVGVAKARASMAAVTVANLAHAVHGALGFTEEFDLQLYTRRLHLWRIAGGSESYWNSVVGTYVIEHHDGMVFDLMRETSDSSRSEEERDETIS